LSEFTRGNYSGKPLEELKDFVLRTKYFSGDQIEKNEVFGACSTYGWRGEMHTGFWLGNVRESVHLEDLGVGGRIILIWIFRKWDGVMDRMNLRVPLNAGNFLTSGEPVSSSRRTLFCEVSK